MESQDAAKITWVFEYPNADLTHLFQTAFLHLELVEPNSRAFQALISKYNELAPDDPPSFTDNKANKQPPECFKNIFTPEVMESFKQYIINLMSIDFGYTALRMILSLKYIPTFPLIKEMFIKDADKACDFSYIFHDAFKNFTAAEQREILEFDTRQVTECPDDEVQPENNKNWDKLYTSYCANLIMALTDEHWEKKLQRIIAYFGKALECDRSILEALYLSITRRMEVLGILQRSQGRLVNAVLEELGHENRFKLIEHKPHFFLEMLKTIQNPEHLPQDLYEDQNLTQLSRQLTMLDMAFLMHDECELVSKMKAMGFQYSPYDALETLELYIGGYYSSHDEVLEFIDRYKLRLPILYRNALHERRIDEHIQAFCTNIDDHPLDSRTSIKLANALFHRLQSIDNTIVQRALLDQRFFRCAIMSLNADLTAFILDNSEQPDELIRSIVTTDALHLVAARGHLELLKLVLDKCKNAELRDSLLHTKYHGFTILHSIAAVPPIDYEHPRCGQINGQYATLAQYWIKQGVDITTPDKDGNTALHFALKFCNKGTVEELLTRAKTLRNPGNFLNARNSVGKTALDIFCEHTLPSTALGNPKRDYLSYDAEDNKVITFLYNQRMATDPITQQMADMLKEVGCKKAEELSAVDNLKSFFTAARLTTLFKNSLKDRNLYVTALCGMTAVLCYDLLIRDSAMTSSIIHRASDVLGKLVEGIRNTKHTYFQMTFMHYNI